jgi:hypothetical protein
MNEVFVVLINLRQVRKKCENMILILGVCILLRVWDQADRVFPSTQR